MQTARIAYLVHDLQDAAVARRVAMLRDGGHDVRVLGFFRRGAAPREVAGAAAVSLGRTRDGALLARLFTVGFALLFPAALMRGVDDAKVLIARNLETLVLAARVRRPGQRLVYECLDIHRLMLGRGFVARTLRGVERRAMEGGDLLLISSPHFRDAYFRGICGYRGPTLLAENKVPAYRDQAGQTPAQVVPLLRPARMGTVEAPWVIGWFGMLRCRRTLAMLGRIARDGGGAIRIVIAGKPSPAEFHDFAAQVAAWPHVSYIGPYTPEDLPRLFGGIHFIWAIDYFEEGLNSAWLLPNRLYEGIAYGAVPIALGEVATGQWLAQRGAGLRLRDPVDELGMVLSALTLPEYLRLRAEVADVARRDVLLLRDEHAALVAQITGVSASTMTGSEDVQSEAVRDASDVLIVIPCLNEEAHLPGLLVQLVADNPGARIVVADGGSQDRSREITLEWGKKHPCIRLLDNPARLQSAGVNLAARRFGGGASWIVRIDAHCSYPRHYVAGLLRAAAEHDATSVVVPMMTQGDEGFQSAVAAAQNSLLGNGGAPHRNLGRGRFVDHGHHALFDLSLFMRAGGYDESFSHNEDAELDHRLRGLGGRIWLEPSQAIVYYPRRSPGRLLRQYVGYGRGRAQNWRRHRMPMALRQAVPLAIAPMVALGILGAATAALTPFGWVMALPMIGWAILCCLYGAGLAWRQRRASVLYAGLAAMIMHLGWSMGFLYELRPSVVRGMKPGATASG